MGMAGRLRVGTEMELATALFEPLVTEKEGEIIGKILISVDGLCNRPVT